MIQRGQMVVIPRGADKGPLAQVAQVAQVAKVAKVEQRDEPLKRAMREPAPSPLGADTAVSKCSLSGWGMC